jgi:hypothetical protein
MFLTSLIEDNGFGIAAGDYHRVRAVLPYVALFYRLEVEKDIIWYVL